MKQEAAIRAAHLFRQQRVAALGTLHDGAPSVTLAPFALADDPFAMIVLVSGLASHTRDMLADPRVALLVAEPAVADSPVHGLARVSIQAIAHPIAPGHSRYESVRAAYVARFPERSDLFSLADFGLYALVPTAVRVVAGFAQAASIMPDSLADAIANSAPTRP